MFQNQGRPQGNINKKGHRYLSKSRPIFFELLKMLKSSFDALDRLYRPDQGGFLGTVLNNSFTKGQFLTKNVFSQILGTNNVQKSVSRSTLGVFSIPNRINKSRLTRWQPQNCPKTSKLDRNRPENFRKNELSQGQPVTQVKDRKDRKTS